MNPEDRLRRLRDDDRWNDEPFVLQNAAARRPRPLAPLKWASIGVGIAAALVGIDLVGSQLHLSGGATSAGTSAQSKQSPAAPASGGVSDLSSGGSSAASTGAIPWADLPADGTATGSSANSDLADIAVSAALPVTIRAGAALAFTVTLTNSGSTTVRFGTCPTYTEALSSASGTVERTYRLNCGEVGALKPGEHAVFAMRIPVPAAAAGPVTVSWRLADGDAATATGMATP